MGITLTKGQSLSLAKNVGLSKVAMGIGWDPAKKGGFLSRLAGNGGGDIDLDASVLVFDNAGRVMDTIWFRQLQGMNGAIRHSGDNRTGDGDGDDETITVDLAALPSQAQTLVFTVNSFTGQTFNDVANAHARLVDTVNRTELAKFTLTEQGRHTGVVMAVVSRKSGAWEMTAIGDPTSGNTVQNMVADCQRYL